MTYRPTPSGLARDLRELARILAFALAQLDRKSNSQAVQVHAPVTRDDATAVG